MVENGESYLYLAESDKMLSSYFLEHDLKLHSDLRCRSLGKYEILRSPTVGSSAVGPPSSLPTARNLEPEMLLRKISF